MCFHKFSKWRQYEHRYSFSPGLLYSQEMQAKTFEGVDTREQRVCEKCGAMQDRLVVEGVGLANKRLHTDTATPSKAGESS